MVLLFLAVICFIAGRRAKVEVVKEPEKEIVLGPLGVPSILPNGGKHPAGTPLVVVPVPHASAYYRIGHPHTVHGEEFRRLDGSTIVLGAPHPCGIPGGELLGSQWQVGQFVVQAFCYAPGREDSEIVTTLIEITPPTGEVFFSHSGGTYEEPFVLNLFHPETTNILYTADGTDPWEGGLPYLNPLYINRSCEIRAVAQGSRAPSLSKHFVLAEELPPPTLALNGELVTQGWAPGLDYEVQSKDAMTFFAKEGGAVYFSMERLDCAVDVEEGQEVLQSARQGGFDVAALENTISKLSRVSKTSKGAPSEVAKYSIFEKRFLEEEALMQQSSATKPACVFTTPPTLRPGRWIVRAYSSKQKWKDSRIVTFTIRCPPGPPDVFVVHENRRQQPLNDHDEFAPPAQIRFSSAEPEVPAGDSHVPLSAISATSRGPGSLYHILTCRLSKVGCVPEEKSFFVRDSDRPENMLYAAEDGEYVLDYFVTDAATKGISESRQRTFFVKSARPVQLLPPACYPSQGTFTVPAQLQNGDERDELTTSHTGFKILLNSPNLDHTSIKIQIKIEREGTSTSPEKKPSKYEKFVVCAPGEEVDIDCYGQVKVTLVSFYFKNFGAGAHRADTHEGPMRLAFNDSALPLSWEDTDLTTLPMQQRLDVGVSPSVVHSFNILPPPPKLCPGGSGSFSVGFMAHLYKPVLPNFVDFCVHYSVSGWVGGVPIQTKSYKTQNYENVIGLADEGRYVVTACTEVIQNSSVTSIPNTASVFSNEIEVFYEVQSSGGGPLSPPAVRSLNVPTQPSAPPAPVFHPIEKYHKGDSLHVYLQVSQFGDFGGMLGQSFAGSSVNHSPAGSPSMSAASPKLQVFYSINKKISKSTPSDETLYQNDHPILITKEDEVDLGGDARGVVIYAITRCPADSMAPNSTAKRYSHVVEKVYSFNETQANEEPEPAHNAPLQPTLTCHATELSLQLKTDDPTVSALYTLNGSAPMTTAEGCTYELPYGHAFSIPAKGTTEVRAVAVDSKKRVAPSRVVSKCFVEGTLPQLPLAQQGKRTAASVELRDDAETPEGCLKPPLFVAHARVVVVVATTKDPTAIVRYTLDGAPPSPFSAVLPSGGVQIAVHGTDAPATFRCVAFDFSNTVCSKEVVQGFVHTVMQEEGFSPEMHSLSRPRGGGLGATHIPEYQAAREAGGGADFVDSSVQADMVVAGGTVVESPSYAVDVPASEVIPATLVERGARERGARPREAVPVLSTEATDPFVRGLTSEKLRQAKRTAMLEDLRKQERHLREEADRARKTR